MSNSKITVSGLALLLAKMQGVDIDVLARAANLPHKNVQAWLGGNRSCLRVNSIVALMALLGLRLDAGVWRLDADRVHFWHLNLGAFTSADRVLGSLTLLSKMLGGPRSPAFGRRRESDPVCGRRTTSCSAATRVVS